MALHGVGFLVSEGGFYLRDPLANSANAKMDTKRRKRGLTEWRQDPLGAKHCYEISLIIILKLN